MIFFRKGYEYQLASKVVVSVQICPKEDIETEFISLTHFSANVGLLTLKQGYAWDGPSGPTIHTQSFMRGSLVHDALYQLMRLGKVDPDQRKYADALLRDICIEDGMWTFRAEYVYQSVRKFGKKSVSGSNLKAILTAP